MQRYPRQAAPQVQSTLAKLSLCRTSALGGRHYHCQDCLHQCVLYNSCGDRHCPQCGGARRADWVESTGQLLLAGVDYYQVVFTLPDKLSSLALGNRQPIYALLFQASWQALRTTIRSEQGYDPAALLVLHTWNQQLDAHAHLHAVIPGGGPALAETLLDGKSPESDSPQAKTWKRTERFGRATSTYLVDESELRRVYRAAFISGLRRLHRQGQLQLAGEFAELSRPLFWEAFLQQLVSTKWVVYIQPPPQENCQPETVVKYLGRYLTGGPISDRRLISADDRQVTFWARTGTTAGGDRQQVPVSLPGVEFVRRWSLHILPPGFTKVRRFGGWSNTRCAAYLAQCRQLLGIRPSQPSAADDSGKLTNAEKERVGFDAVENDEAYDREESKAACCPKCQAKMMAVLIQDKPPWSEVLHSAQRPAWYAWPSGFS